MSDSRIVVKVTCHRSGPIYHIFGQSTSFDGITNPCWWVGTHFLWVTRRCCFVAWLMNSEIDPLGWEKIQLKSTQEGNGNPGYNTGDVPIMISEYPWEIKCPQNRSSAWFLSNSLFYTGNSISPQLLLKMNWFGLQKRYSILLLLLLHQGAIKMSTL